MTGEVAPEVTSGLVTTILPVRNRPDLLREAFASIVAQTYRPIEILVVDDGSTDETGTVAEEVAAAHPEVARVIHQQNKGPGLAREAGRRVARGEFIQYLDSDDLLAPRKFELQVAGLRAHPECGVSYGKTRQYLYGAEPRDEAIKRTGQRIETMFPAFLVSRWWSTSTPLFRRSVTELAGPWSELCNEEDWEYDCRVASLGTRLHYCDEFVSDTRYAPGPRQSAEGATDPAKLRDRARAHVLIHSHATRAGIGPEAPEMAHFARELFLLSRQCGAAGLTRESRELFHLARHASAPERARALDFRLYGLLARLLGWTTVGRLACASDSWRRR